MPRLYSSNEIAAGLERAGFAFVSQRGSHKQIPRETFRSILRQSGLAERDFG